MNQLAEPFPPLEDAVISRHHYRLPDVRCAGCCLKIEKELAALGNLSDIKVSYALKRLSFTSAPDAAPQAVERITSLGYEIADDDTAEALNSYRAERKAMLSKLGVAGIGMMQVMMYALATYLAPEDGMAHDIESLFRWASFIIAIPVTFYSAMPFHRGALRDLRNRTVGMDVPVSLAILSAFSLSVVHTLTATGEVYFDSACMFTFFLLTGRYLELSARQKFQVEKSLGEHLLPRFAKLLNGDQVLVDALREGDVVVVAPGETVPADGRILEGTTSTDESAFTGESRPVNKQPGAMLLAGSMNLDGSVQIEVQTEYGEWLINRLGELYREAAGFKPHFAVLADRIARYFVVTILCLASASGFYWWSAGSPDAFAIALAVLVVSCPCALSLATPIAYSIATGALGKLGVLVSHGAFLEKLHQVDSVVLDKTGTLTEGTLQLTQIVPVVEQSVESLVSIAASIEETSLHPVAATLRKSADYLQRAENIEVEPGFGVTGTVDHVRYRLGKPRYAWQDELARPEGDGTWVLLANEQEPLAWFCFVDVLREEAPAVVEGLAERADHVAVFSGDTSTVSQSLLDDLGLSDVVLNMSPEDKLRAVQSLQAQGRQVLMVGDGLNDTGAMAVADVSIAFSPVDTVVQSAADATLVKSDLRSLLTVVDYSNKVTRVIRQNLFWAFTYNVTVIPLAVMGLLPPWLAALGMSFSSLLVTMNACRLARG